MTLEPTSQSVAALGQPIIQRRFFLQAAFGGVGLCLFCGGARSAAAETLTPAPSTPPKPKAGDSSTAVTAASSQELSPSAVGNSGKYADSAHYPSFTIGSDSVIHHAVSNSRVLPSHPSVLVAPYFTQFDGSAYAETNCGPTALAMALGALGVPVAPLALRVLANEQMGTSDPNNGTSWESLAFAAKQNGVSAFGLTSGSSNSYRTWSIGDLQGELAKQRPVLLLIRYWDLPDHKDSSYAGDHYVVALGADGDNIVYSDPASNDGSYLVVTSAQLQVAWRNPASGLAFTAMSLYR